MKPTLNNGSRDGTALDLPCYSTTFHNRTSCTRLHISHGIRVVLATITVPSLYIIKFIYPRMLRPRSFKQAKLMSMQGPFY